MASSAHASARPFADAPVFEAAVSLGFDELYAAYVNRVYTLASYLCEDRTAAQDVTQNVFLKVYQGLDAFRHDAEVSTWIHRITVNACLDYRRRQRVRRFLSWSSLDGVDVVGPDTDAPDVRLQRDETQRRVQLALRTLPTKYRVPILLKYLEDLSYQEIADILKCRVGTVASRLSRGQRLLARKLRQGSALEGGEP